MRRFAVVFGFILISGPVSAQTVTLAESPKPGDLARHQVELTVTGNLIVTQDAKKQEIKLEAKAGYDYVQKTLAVDGGLPLRSVRLFSAAEATALIGGDRETNALSADRRLVLANRTVDGLVCWSPAGAVTREELDLVAEQFDPHCLPGLLPGKAVAVGDTWAVANAAAHSACLFDSLIKNSLTGTLTAVADGFATIAITGTAEGIDNGAKVVITVNATAKYHLETGRIVEVLWKQADERDQGPANPASKLEATVLLKRAAAAEPKELAQADWPAEPPAPALLLRFSDPKARYEFRYPRDWHITGQTDDHLILRLLDRGELIAQCTLTAWKKAEPGQHVSVDDFKKAIGDSPGWVPSKVLEEGEIPLDGGRWLYRIAAEGKMEDQPAVQAFHMLAGPQGDQVAVTFAMRPDKMKLLGPRDVALVKSLSLGKK